MWSMSVILDKSILENEGLVEIWGLQLEQYALDCIVIIISTVVNMTIYSDSKFSNSKSYVIQQSLYSAMARSLLMMSMRYVVY